MAKSTTKQKIGHHGSQTTCHDWGRSMNESCAEARAIFASAQQLTEDDLQAFHGAKQEVAQANQNK